MKRLSCSKHQLAVVQRRTYVYMRSWPRKLFGGYMYIGEAGRISSDTCNLLVAAQLYDGS